jgi:hypothetical protein
MTVDEFVGGCQLLLKARGVGSQANRSYNDGVLRISHDRLHYQFNIFETVRSGHGHSNRPLIAISETNYVAKIGESEFAATCGHLVKHLQNLLILDQLAAEAP